MFEAAKVVGLPIAPVRELERLPGDPTPVSLLLFVRAAEPAVVIFGKVVVDEVVFLSGRNSRQVAAQFFTKAFGFMPRHGNVDPLVLVPVTWILQAF